MKKIMKHPSVGFTTSPFQEAWKKKMKRYKLVRRFLGTHLTAALYGWYLYEGPSNLSLAKMAALWGLVDDSTTEVTIETPEGWKCDRKGCTADYLHSHGTYAALSHTHCWDQIGTPPCGMMMGRHTQCCLCEAKTPQFEY